MHAPLSTSHNRTVESKEALENNKNNHQTLNSCQTYQTAIKRELFTNLQRTTLKKFGAASARKVEQSPHDNFILIIAQKI